MTDFELPGRARVYDGFKAFQADAATPAMALCAAALAAIFGRREMNTESDEECTADYGVFGDRACSCSSCRPPVPRPLTAQEIAQSKRKQDERERERQTSRNFNRAMIDLYNQKRKHP